MFTFTVQRAFRWAKEIGVIDVRRIRTGKRPDQQYNEYSLNVEKLKQLQQPEQAAPVPPDGDAKTLHLTPEHASINATTGGTDEAKGFEVSQRASKSGTNPPRSKHRCARGSECRSA